MVYTKTTTKSIDTIEYILFKTDFSLFFCRDNAYNYETKLCKYTDKPCKNYMKCGNKIKNFPYIKIYLYNWFAHITNSYKKNRRKYNYYKNKVYCNSCKKWYIKKFLIIGFMGTYYCPICNTELRNKKMIKKYGSL